jgi:class 3 adenylate cyclase
MEVTGALADVVAVLAETGWAAEVVDASWQTVWASDELRLILHARSDEEIGIGRNVLESRRATALSTVTVESGRSWLALHAPYVMWDTGATVAELRALCRPDLREALTDDLAPAPPPARWTFRLDVEGLGAVRGLGSRIVDDEGHVLGVAFLYGSTMPASLLASVAGGNTAHFSRMAELVEPRRRNAAVLFADVEGSTERSRRLPSARYFAAVRELNTTIDAAILDEGGIVGKHAGDGVSAFFLADQIGGISRAARAGIAAARTIRRAGERLEGSWKINVGVHWGATLYMGQIATSGRLEVTALGDEVNECARVQEAATGGQLLASKPLLERLDAADAAALDLDPTAIEYCLLAELPGAGEKVRRDAPSLAVAEL